MYKSRRLLRIFLVIAWINFNILFVVLAFSLPLQETYDMAKATPVPTRRPVDMATLNIANPFVPTATPFFTRVNAPR